MNSDSQNHSNPKSGKQGKVGISRLWRLARKELRETLRDRRTIITLILMPLLVYPILSLVFQNFLINNIPTNLDGPVQYVFALESNLDETATTQELFKLGKRIRSLQPKTDPAPPLQNDPHEVPSFVLIEGSDPAIADVMEHQWQFRNIDENGNILSVPQQVAIGNVDAGLIIEWKESTKGRYVDSIQIFQREDRFSKEAAGWLGVELSKLAAKDAQLLSSRVGVRGMMPNPNLKTLQLTEEQSGTPAGTLVSMIPLALVLMTITGAVYPAIDLTAGERERGTLETLMASPVPRMSILFAKFIAVLTVAIMTAILNLAGMSLVMWFFQMDQFLPGGGFSIGILAKIFFLLILFAAFFSGCLLMVTSFARSFKEAQAYLVPLVLFSLGPGLIAMSPNIELTGFTSAVPMLNLLVLARDILKGTAALGPAIIAVVSTLVYAFVAITIAAKMFGADSILYAQQQSLSSLLARPRKASKIAPLVSALLCLALLLPVNMIALGIVGRVSSTLQDDYTAQCLLIATFTAISFFVIPTVIAWFRKVDLREGFGLKMTSPVFFVAALVLGISLWPLLMILFKSTYALSEMLGGEIGQSGKQDIMRLAEEYVVKFRQVHPLVIAFCFAIVPACCEEWFFRGMLQRSLLSEWKPRNAILASALAFGVFHILSNSVVSPSRFLSTFLIGLLLGYLAYRSNSILPGILLHALHNAAAVFLGYYSETLEKHGWVSADGVQNLYILVLVAAVVAMGGLWLLIYNSPSPKLAKAGTGS